MHSETYFHTQYEIDADRKNQKVPLQVNCVGIVSSAQGFSIRRVRQDFYYIYMLKGKLVMEDCELFPGDVLILEPEQFQQYHNEGETAYLWVHYTGFEALSLTKSVHLEINKVQYIGAHKEIEDCFYKLFREFMIHDESFEQMAVCLLREILILTGRYSLAEGNRRMPLEAIAYIHQNFKSRIDVEQLAEMEHMSGTVFREVFHRHTGVSPNEYIIRQRMSAACRMLTQTGENVGAVAAAVGYQDPFYFSRIFKKKVGMTPGEYRLEKGKGIVS